MTRELTLDQRDWLLSADPVTLVLSEAEQRVKVECIALGLVQKTDSGFGWKLTYEGYLAVQRRRSPSVA